MELGVTLIDMGGGVTSIAVLAGGKLLYTDVIPIGGTHVTSDLAKGLSCSIPRRSGLKPSTVMRWRRRQIIKR